MNLTQLSDEELNCYAGSLKGGSEQERREAERQKFICKLEASELNMKAALNEFPSIKRFLKDGELWMAGKLCVKIIGSLNTCLNDLNVVLFNSGYKDFNDAMASGKGMVEFEEMDNEVLHIKFNSLLPKKIKREGRYITNQYKILQARYRDAFIEHFSGRKFRIYDEKATICFIHHFSTEHLIRDHDNFETKFIIDFIAGYVLTDDNAKYLAHFHDYIVDGKDYSEIYVMPERVFWKRKFSSTVL